MNRNEQMEKDIQKKIVKVIKDKETFKSITDGNSAIFHDLEVELSYYAWPGGYPLYYVTKDCGVLCPKCVNDNIELLSDPYDPQWYVVGYDVNYESDDLYCDHCNERIESAYGDDDE